MKTKLYVCIIIMMLMFSQVLAVSAAESAKADITVSAPTGAAAAVERSEQWLCDSAGLMMVSDLGQNTVLLNCLKITTTAAAGTTGDYTFGCAAVSAGMNVKTYAYNDFTGMWQEVACTVKAGSVTVNMDAASNSNIAIIVVK